MSDLESGEIIEVNPSYCNMSGYTWDELIGKTSAGLGIFESEECRNLILRDTKMHDLGKSQNDLNMQKKSVETFDASLPSRIIRMRERDYRLTIVRDVTEQKKAEEKVRKSEELYCLLADNTQDVIWIMDLSMLKAIYVSPSIERLLGMPTEMVLSLSLQEVLTRESFTNIMQLLPPYLEDLMDGKKPPYSNINIDMVRSDGSIVSTETNLTYIRDTSGNIFQVMGISRDISSRIQIEEKLRRSEHHYRLLAESIKDVVWIIDPITLRFKYISPSTTPLLGWTPDELYIKIYNIEFFLTNFPVRLAIGSAVYNTDTNCKADAY